MPDSDFQRRVKFLEFNMDKTHIFKVKFKCGRLMFCIDNYLIYRLKQPVCVLLSILEGVGYWGRSWCGRWNLTHRPSAGPVELQPLPQWPVQSRAWEQQSCLASLCSRPARPLCVAQLSQDGGCSVTVLFHSG